MQMSCKGGVQRCILGAKEWKVDADAKQLQSCTASEGEVGAAQVKWCRGVCAHVPEPVQVYDR